MSWGKVCDTLHSHRKAARAGLEAMGLWVLALSWCRDKGTGGHVPADRPALLADDPAAAARCTEALVLARLWDVEPEGGWRFHDWDEFQETEGEEAARRAQISALRAAAGRRGAEVTNGKRSTNPGDNSAKDGKAGNCQFAAAKAAPLPSDPQPQPQPQPQHLPDPEPRGTGSAGSEPPGSGPSPSELEQLQGDQLEAPSEEPPAPRPQPQAVLQLAEPPKLSVAERIFAAFLEGWRRVVHGSRPPKLDDKRRALIAARLRDFSPEDLEQAARGIWLCEWHVAEWSKRISLEIALRDSPHVEKFRAIAERPELGREQGPATLQRPAKPGEFQWKRTEGA